MYNCKCTSALCIPGRETLLGCAWLPASLPRAPCNCALLIGLLCKSTASCSTTCNVQFAMYNVQCAVLGGQSVRTTLPLLPPCPSLHAHSNWDSHSFAQICKFVVSCARHVLCTLHAKESTRLLLFPSSCKSVDSQILPLFLMFQLQGIPWKELLLYFNPRPPT